MERGILYSVRQPQRRAGSSVQRWGSVGLGGAQRRAPTRPGGSREGFLEEARSKSRREGKGGVYRVTGGGDGAGRVFKAERTLAKPARKRARARWRN